MNEERLARHVFAPKILLIVTWVKYTDEHVLLQYFLFQAPCIYCTNYLVHTLLGDISSQPSKNSIIYVTLQEGWGDLKN